MSKCQSAYVDHASALGALNWGVKPPDLSDDPQIQLPDHVDSPKWADSIQGDY